MASNETSHHTVSSDPSAAHNHESAADPLESRTTTSPTQIQQQTDELPSSTPLEMSHLTSPPNQSSVEAATSSEQSHPQSFDGAPEDSNDASQLQPPPTVFDPQSEPAQQPTRPARNRQQSEAIGPSTEEALTASSILQQTNSTADSGPAVLINLILLSGARHPFKIDLRYLRKRNVAKEGEEMDPFQISVYTMKELIWRDWRDEWEPRPTIPGAIRLIHFGKLLDDKQSLKDCRFQPATPNVVHMTVRPQDIVEEEENAKSQKAASSRRGRGDDGERDAGCCSCVIL